jgi:DNA-binding Lrp family transcriptional regulator
MFFRHFFLLKSKIAWGAIFDLGVSQTRSIEMKTRSVSKRPFARAYNLLFYLVGSPISRLRPGSKLKMKLNYRDFVCYLLLIQFSFEGTRDFFASSRRFARILGCSKDTIKRSFKKLERAGLITRLGFQVTHRPSRQVQLFERQSDANSFLARNPGWTYSTTKYSVTKPTKLFSILEEVKNMKMAPYQPEEKATFKLPSFLMPRAEARVGVGAETSQGGAQKCKVKKKKLVLRMKKLKVDSLISGARPSRDSNLG